MSKKIIGIYKIENIVNGRSYIGQSVNVNGRVRKHFSNANLKKNKAYDYPLMKGIRKYGKSKFKVTILEECKRDELNEKEMFWIEKENSFVNGYNQDAGGKFSARFIRLDHDSLKSIRNYLKNTDLIHSDIALKHDISTEMVQGINTGRYWYSDNIKYPIRKVDKVVYFCKTCNVNIVTSRNINCVPCYKESLEVNSWHYGIDIYEIIDRVLELGFLQAGKYYGVSDNAIRKLFIKNGIPDKKKDILEYLEQQEEK